MSIHVEHLTCAYRDQRPVLRDVTTRFESGKLAFVAGASGSGKTTLMRCINGLIPHRYPDGALTGAVLLDDQRVANLTLMQVSRRVGTVLQDTERQLVATDVEDELAFGLENVALPRDEIHERIRNIAERLGITGLLERKTFSLSGGEKQKVAIAGVLAMNPRAVLLDEPLASLDPASAREAMALFRALADEGVAVVVVEHRHPYVLAAHPDQCVLLDGGALAYDGPAAGFPSPATPARRAIAPADPGGRSLVTLDAVSFRHGTGPQVLSDVSFTVRAGDIIALLGANGAGKSTLCRHFIGLHRPSSGRVRIGETDAAGMTIAQIAQQVGYVFQNPGVMLFAPTMREELSFGPKNVGQNADAIARNIVRAAEAVNLADRMESSPFALSFGQQKRVSVACVIAMGTRVMVLDEPTAGQDTDNVLRLMDDLSRPGQFDALVFATHDLELVRAYANRVVVMSAGRIVADGEPDAVLADRALLERCRLL